MAESPWGAGLPCEEHEEPFCQDCRPTARVWITDGGGGPAYHLRNRCPALRSGQAKVSARGGTPAGVIRVDLSVAKQRGKQPCLICVQGVPWGGPGWRRR